MKPAKKQPISVAPKLSAKSLRESETITITRAQFDVVWEALNFAMYQCQTAIENMNERDDPWFRGDWLNHGESAYGEMYAQAVNESQASTWQNYAWVASAIESSRRRELLSWGHHREVAPLSPEEQEYWLSQAEPAAGNSEPKLSVRELRAAIRNAKLLASTPEMPSGVYRVIYADPPWKRRTACAACAPS